MKKLIAIFTPLLVLAVVILTAVIPTNVYAETFDNLGLTISGSDIQRGIDYDITSTDGSDANNVLAIKSAKEMTISGTATGEARILVTSEKGANLILKDLRIELFRGSLIPNELGVVYRGNCSSAFLIEDSVKDVVTVTLEGENVLISGEEHAGLENNSVPLVIQGNGSLEASGFGGGAGIGGGKGRNGENITIKGGTITATGVGGAGIGGGENGNASGIVIEDGNVTAEATFRETEYVKQPNGYNKPYSDKYSYAGGAGIGGGKNGSCIGKEDIEDIEEKEGSGITISGGTVNASGMRGAGIGGGLHGNGEYIKISGGTVFAKVEAPHDNEGSHNGSAGIGGGCGGNAAHITICGGTVTGWNCVNSDGKPASNGAGIGGGAYCAKNEDGSNKQEGTGGNAEYITITGTAIVDADGATYGGAGIGGGQGGSCNTITIALEDGGKIKAHGGSGAGIGSGSGGNCETINISGSGTIEAKNGGGRGAGIGGGTGGEGKTINISGTVQITAIAEGGAGIGGGEGKDGIGIVIDVKNPGFVIAECSGASSGSAGIGGGSGANGYDITIKGGKVTATGGSGGGAGIGGGLANISYPSYPDYVFGTTGGNGYKITIEGGEIKATGGSNGAGIGGGQCGSGSHITIEGYDKIVATGGGNYGAGIGGGANGSGTDIKIIVEESDEDKNDPEKYIQAIGGYGAAGIGGGFNMGMYNLIGGNAERITITGGKVKAEGGSGGAGIGSGQKAASAGSNAEGIIISGEANVTVTSQNGGAGIGSGAGGTVSNAEIVKDGETFIVPGIEISGNANVTATSAGGAGIGGGSGGAVNNTEIVKNGETVTVPCIEISGSANVTATSTSGAGIGSGSGGAVNNAEIEKDGETVTVPGIEISGNVKITATSKGGAGIGSGADGSCKDMAISGGSVAATGVYYTYDVTTTQDGVTTTTTYTYNPPGIDAQKLTIDGEDTVVNARGGGSGTGITGGTITINNGVVTAVGGDDGGTGIGGEDSTVKIEGTSSTSCPWVFTNKITSTNGDDKYWGIVFEDEDGNSFTDIEDNNFNKGIVYGRDKTVELTEQYTLIADKILRVQGSEKSDSGEVIQKGATLETENKLELAGILYIEAGATLDKYNKLTLTATGEIQHEDASPYVEDGSGKWLCDICGKEEPHKWKDEWVNDDPAHHWHECDPGKDCSLSTNQLQACSITEDSKKDGYAEHNYDFDNPIYKEDGKLHYICIDCGYEFAVAIPVIQLIKADDNDDPLVGAEFGIYSDEKCENPIITKIPNASTTAITAMADGKAVVSFAAELNKTYYIKETKAPDGYTASDKVFKAVVDKSGNVTYGDDESEDIPVCKNTKIVSDTAKIIKVDGETGEPLADAEFGIYSDADCEHRITTAITEIDTDEDSAVGGKAIVSFDTELYNTYYIKEIKAPYGYTASDKVFKAVVGADGKVTYGDVDSAITSEDIPICENYAIVSDPAKIIKVDGETGEPLTGAEFGIYSDADCTDPIKTETTAKDAEGNAVVSFTTRINTTYYIKETKAPDGYTASDKVFKAVVDADGKVTYGDVDSAITSEDIPVCENEKTAAPDTPVPPVPDNTPSDSAKIIKVDSATKNPLAGAQFGLYSDEECTELITAKTTAIEDNKAVVSFDTEPNKTYYIKEIKAPDGYTASDKVFKAVVDADGKVTYGVLDSATTSEDIPVCENEKTAAPDTPVPPVPDNTPSDSAKIIKVDSATQNPLAGAQFGLYSDEECTELITTGTTAIDADNKAVASFGTEPNKTYYIKEIKAPDGYTASDEVFKAVVDADGKVTYGVLDSATTSEDIPVCENEKTAAPDTPVPPVPDNTPSDSAKIIKVDSATQNPLAGAQFGLYSDEECTELITAKTTAIDADNKAVVSFDTEPNKTYYIKEIKAPDGYTASDEVFKAVVDADGKVTYGDVDSEITSEDIPVCENEKTAAPDTPVPDVPVPDTPVPDTSVPSYTTPSSVKLIKVDSDTKNPLAGAEFGLYSDEGCTVLITTGTTAIDTDNKAVVSFNTGWNKTYYIKETKAPDGYTASDEVFKAVVDADGKVTYGAAGSLVTSEDIPVCENEKTPVPDTSVPDTSVPDTSVSDTSVPDTSVPDMSVPDTSVTDTSVPDMLVPSYTPASSAKLIKVDSVTKNPLAGAQFGLYSDEECTVLIMTGITAINSDNKAIVSFDTERNKTYYIKEIKAPDGYKVSDEMFKAVVDADGKVTYSVSGSLVTSEDIPVCENKKLTDADMSVPRDTTYLGDENNPHTGIGLGAAGFVILSGIICSVSLAKGAQSGRKRKNNDDDV